MADIGDIASCKIDSWAGTASTCWMPTAELTKSPAGPFDIRSTALHQNNQKVRAVTQSSADFAVLIPTHDGTDFLQRAIIAHGEMVKKDGLIGVEIVVSDNGSGPETESIVRSLMRDYPFVRYIRQDRYFDTAEEHLYCAMRSVEHEWVWLFGDDDIPLSGSLHRLLELARLERYDFLFCNLRCFMVDGINIHPGRNSEYGLIEAVDDHEVDIRTLVAELGFQTCVACFSGTVVRRRVLADSRFSDYLNAAPVYSHVAAYLDAFSASPCLFIGTPLVEYRTGATTMDNWQQLARRHQQTVHAPWTIGIVRLFNRLMANDMVSPNYLFDVVEHSPDHRFYLWVHLLQKVVEEIEAALTQEDSGLLPTDDDLKELTALLSRYHAGSLPLELGIRIAASHRMAKTALEARAFSGSGVRAVQRRILIPVREHVHSELAVVRSAFPVCPQLPAFGSPYSVGQTVEFNSREADRYIVGGFYGPEDWGRWTEGKEAVLVLRHDAVTSDLLLTIEIVMTFAGRGRSASVGKLIVNSAPAVTVSFNAPATLQTRIRATDLDPGGRMRIRLSINHPKLIDDSPVNEDRALGIGVKSFRLTEAGNSRTGSDGGDERQLTLPNSQKSRSFRKTRKFIRRVWLDR